MGKKLLGFMAAMFLSLALFPMMADAGGSQMAQPKIRVGYIDYDGFITQEKDGTYSGYGVEYLQEISEYTGWKYEYVYDTWEHQLKALEEGKIDLLCHAQKTRAREDHYLFSKYSDGSESSVLYVRDSDDRYYYNDFEHFTGMKIAVLTDSYQNQEFAEYAAQKGVSYEYVYYDTPVDCFRALDDKQVDAVAMGSLALRSKYKVICRFGSDPFYFITGKENAALMNRLDDAMGQITSAGSTFNSELYQKYYGAEVFSTKVIFTREEAACIDRNPEVTIAFIPNRQPFSDETKANGIYGITVDIVKLIEKRSGLHFKYTMIPEGMRTTEYLEQNPDTIVAGALINNPQFYDDKYLLSNTLYTDDVALACRSGMEYHVDAGDAAYTLAITKGYAALETYIHKNYPQFKTVYGDSTRECLALVKKGKADFAAQNVNVIQPILSDPHFEDISILPTFFMNENTGMVCKNTKQNKMLMEILDKCILTVSAKEKSQFTVDHTVANGYRLTWSDVMYKFRYSITLISLLVIAVLGLMVAFSYSRRRSYQKLQEKNNQLAEALSQANNANIAKSQFLARMSHEIRTPINAIVGLTALTEFHKEDSGKVEEYLGKIKVSSKVLLNIINDVLDMSAIENNKIKISHASFDLGDLLTSISTVYYTQCKQKGVYFIMDTSGVCDEKLLGDSLRVNQILLNLISNAYKFTPPGGKVTVTVREVSTERNRAYFQFTVEDTGEGMAEEMRKRLFRPFEQEGAETSKKHGGSGLGLSITKNLVDLMDGSICCESIKDVGTRFFVSLPFEIDSQKSRQDISCKPVRALVVDEEVETREYTAVMLESIGVPFSVACGRSEALMQLEAARREEKPFDICFIDWKMPVMSEEETTLQIRKSYDENELAIIVSAYDTAEIQEHALAAGASMFLAKPVFQSAIFNLLMKMSGGKLIRQTAHKAYDFTGKRVLLAEDTELNAEIAMELLAMANMKTDHVANGKEAVELFEASEPGTYHAILMDVQMPVMDGYEAAKQIRSLRHSQAATIPIFAMTANAFAEDVSAALNAGMNGHIAKPIDTEILYETLHKVM